MSKTLSQILGGVSMTTAAQSVQRGLPNVLPASFMQVTRRVVGNSVRWNKVDGGRELARLAQYGSPAQLVGRKGLSQAQATLAHVFEQITHDPMVLQNLQRTDSPEIQQLAIEEIDRQTADFIERANSLRVAMVYSLLANGKIWFDATGKLLYSATSATQTVDFGIPTENSAQLGGLITDWSSDTADIIGQIVAIKKRAIQSTGYPLMHAFYGANIAGYIARNTAVKSFLGGSPELSSAIYSTGEIPTGFCGIDWHPAYAAFGVDDSGAISEFFGPDAIVFTPDPTPDWYELVEGSYLVPRRVDLTNDAVAAAGNLATVYGRFSYAIPTHNPVSIQHFAGDTVLPLLKTPAAVFQVDVTP